MSYRQAECFFDSFTRLFLQDGMTNRCGLNPRLVMVYKALKKRTAPDCFNADKAMIYNDFKQVTSKLVNDKQS